MKKPNLYLFLIILLFLFTSSCRKSEEISNLNDEIISIAYYTENYPPFNYEQEGLLYGVSVDVLEAVFVKMGVDPTYVDVELGAWDDIYNTVLEESSTMLFSTVLTPERESLFKWVGPIAPQKQILMAKAGSGIVIINDEDMANYKIGVIDGYSDYDILLDLGVPASNMQKFEDVNTLFDKLIDNAVDCIAYTEISSSLIIESMGLNPDDFENAYTFKVSQLYYAFNIGTSEQIINYFQEAFDAVKLDKTGDGSSVYEKILNTYQVIQYIEDNITEQMVIDLVDQTSVNISENAAATFTAINQGEAPYEDPDYPGLYAFVYDTEINIVAHATNPLLVGVNFRGKTDVAGKPFRDEIVNGALANGAGWVDYIYTRPDESGLYYKTTYYKLTEGSDGQQYVVCAGKYKNQ